MLNPFTLVLVYFVFLIGYSVIDPDLTEKQWVVLNNVHNLIAITAGVAFAFSNRPIDKGSFSFLWAYVFILACFDWLIPVGYIQWFAVPGAVAAGWIIYRKWTDKLIFGGKET